MKSKYLFLIILISLSCINKTECQYKIDPRAFDNNEISLAEIADDISYIPLDNNIPIGDIVLAKFIKNSIYVKISNIGLVAFNRDGKIPRKIGSVGRGPGEYLYCTSFDVDEINETIYIKDMDEIIKVYSKNGNFLRSIPLKHFEPFHFNDIELSNSNLFVFEYITMGRGKFNWLVLDTLGKLIKKKENSIPAFRSGMGADGGTYKFGSKIYYWNMYNDTIFSISPDLSYKASYIFPPGDYRMPRSPITDRTGYIVPRFIFETNRYLMYEYFDGARFADALIDKRSKKSFINYLEPDHTGGIINNLDSGTKFRSISYFVENGQEYLIGSVNAFQLKAYVASDIFKNSVPKYPEKKKELEKMVNKLNETDNPILMIVRLKR
jgi:hypothetical protein